MEEHEKGREAFANEDEYRLHALRHSTAHVMAEAIGTVFPGAKFTVGPPIKDGFFYDVRGTMGTGLLWVRVRPGEEHEVLEALLKNADGETISIPIR